MKSFFIERRFSFLLIVLIFLFLILTDQLLNFKYPSLYLDMAPSFTLKGCEASFVFALSKNKGCEWSEHAQFP
jgi:hypothetical protein